MKKSTSTLLIILFVVAVVCCDFLTIKSTATKELNKLGQKSRRMRQNAWAEMNPGWDSNYEPGFFGVKPKKVYNVLGDRQRYDYKERELLQDTTPIPGMRSDRTSLLQQPFASAFNHTDEKFAVALPTQTTDPESPFAGVEDGVQPWSGSYKEGVGAWAGEKLSGMNSLFDVYQGPFEFERNTGSISAAPISGERPENLDAFESPTPWNESLFT